jgi:hypothetical protein
MHVLIIRTIIFLLKEITLILLKSGFIKSAERHSCTQYLTVKVNNQSTNSSIDFKVVGRKKSVGVINYDM